MKKAMLFLACLSLLVVPVLATTPHTVSFTGVSSTDFAVDEVVYTNPSTSSAWGAGNILNKLYITWDSNSIYFGVDGFTSSNTNDMWISFSKGNGATGTLTSIDPWGKLFSASANWKVDYVYHNYCDGVDTTNFQYSSLTGGANMDWNASVTQKSDSLGNSEVAIPWSLIGLQNNQIVRVVATISGGGYDGPSSLPDQVPSIQGTGATDELNHWVEIVVTDGSGTPLSGVNPSTASSVSSVPVELSNFTAE